MKSNNSLNLGLSATWSIPMNRKFQKQCHEAAAQISQVQQLTANKRLDFEIAQVEKLCSELMKASCSIPRLPMRSYVLTW